MRLAAVACDDAWDAAAAVAAASRLTLCCTACCAGENSIVLEMELLCDVWQGGALASDPVAVHRCRGHLAAIRGNLYQASGGHVVGSGAAFLAAERGAVWLPLQQGSPHLMLPHSHPPAAPPRFHPCRTRWQRRC